MDTRPQSKKTSPTQNWSPKRPRLLPLILLTATAAAAQSSPGPPLIGELALAAARTDFSRIETLLLLGVSPNQRDIHGQTALNYALKAGNAPLTRRLLTANANPNLPDNTGLTPLMQAVRLGREDLTLMLLESGANPNIITETSGQAISALSLAIDRGEFPIARRLLTSGAEGLFLAEEHGPNPLLFPALRTPIDTRIWRNLARLRDAAQSPDWRPSPWALHRAARDGNRSAALALLKNGANPNKADPLGVTPLITAAWHGHYTLAELLLKQGANAAATDIYGTSAIGYAAAGGHLNITDLLLTRLLMSAPEYLNPNAERPLEASPYYFTLAAGHRAIFSRLIEYRYPLPNPGEQGLTLLMIAAWLGDVFAADKLIAAGADILARDEQGRSALEWSTAAFARDRSTGLEKNIPGRGSSQYPIARMLIRQILQIPGAYRKAVLPEVVEAWAPGSAESPPAWRNLRPSPVPLSPGNGDLTLYRILRNEEPPELSYAGE
ncbi:MAG: hypothetical protein B0D92_08545 [Spirochaeta sp. LUC14_002_19_P3]|nr:MAG: hypothetical protein B0D92_08545 [Spirochaeta sp. LUC14_002_19_P3]